MAQNITWLGNSYSNVPFIQLPKTGGGDARFDDASVTTATASDVASGKVFVASDGTVTTGTGSGGGGSSWTKVAETSYQVSGSSTTATTVATWETGHSEIWTSDKIVYVRIRDTVGKREAYFYGTDTFFMNMYPANSSTATSTASGSIINIWSVNTSTGNPYTQRYGYSSTGYGVFPSMFYSDGRIQISYRVNSAYSRAVNSIYSVEVYLLDPPTGAPIFT